MVEGKEEHKHTNRLINETSPYLLQHAHNPVDWYPWGDEALKRARTEDKLILLSIGYSACHWCHVMERESFEDEAIATLMNDGFVNVKVDREERPDLDEIYMAATVAMNRGQGGWPMTVFLTPELEPVFAGTYFPPHDMHGRPGFSTLLVQVSRAWHEDRESLRRRAGEFAEMLRRHQDLGPPLSVGEAELKQALGQYSQEFDAEYGGFGPAPKFPPAVGISLLLRLHRRFGDPHALAMARGTLEAMARGGMYDHVGGGFARYSTDRRWLVPHFEKMLYDNALLAKAYLEGYQVTGDEFFRRVATETLDYILREMVAAEGGFFSSTDADSEGEEGRFFVWTPEQIAEVLDEEEARQFNAYYDISPAGNWEGVSIPNAPRALEAVAEQLGVDPDELERSLETARNKVYEARQRRVKPGLDDKIITAWNGLMIGALAEGHRVLGEPRYLEAAERAAGFVLDKLSREDGGLYRTYREGKAHLNAVLEDYAYLSEALIDLYEAGGSIDWLREAEQLLERTLADFHDEETGSFFNTASDHEKLIIRYRDGADGATPSGNAVTAHALARLSYHLDRHELRHAAVGAIKAFGPLISRFPRAFATTFRAVDLLLEGPVEIALVGEEGATDLDALQRAVAEHYLPNRIVAVLDPDADDGSAELPLLRGKQLVNGRAALYVCRNFACRAPVTDPAAVAAALDAPLADERRSTTIAIHLPGRATPADTARYAARFPGTGSTELGATGLRVGRL
ncbi:MAG: thioredoxin domain-containing protein, partial [Gemmatimonadales bacterium]